MLFIIGTSVYVVLFMSIFRTNVRHDHPLTLEHNLIFGVVTFVTLFASIIVLPRVFPRAMDPVQWNVGKYSLHLLANLMVMGLLSALIDDAYISPQHTLAINFLHAYRQVGFISVIPIILTSLILRNNMLRDNLQSALEDNRELDRLRTLDQTNAPRKHAVRIILRSETSETLALPLDDLLFVRADDNYSTVFWNTDNGIQKKLLRANLKHIEAQINSRLVIRCHRSYLIHVMAISNISGNANGYKLQVLNSEHSIPVSRAKGREIIETIRQHSGIMAES